jgi:Putative transposase DNA-binding domain
VWNLAVEQQSWWRPGRRAAPGYCAHAAQLTQARAEHRWLRDGSQMAQQQALRDFAQAMANYFAGTHRKPTWRKEGRDEGFRIVAVKPGHIRRLPEPIRKGSQRRARVKTAIARLRAREGDRRKDWAEKTSTDLARRFDVIRIEDLRIAGMTRSARGTLAQPGRGVRQKAGLSRGILASGWGLLARRLQDKAPGRVEKINPAYTSQRCSACGHVAADSRKNQALFRCVACGYVCHADVNAARNTAAGYAVAARGRSPLGGRMNREPQLLAS